VNKKQIGSGFIQEFFRNKLAMVINYANFYVCRQ